MKSEYSEKLLYLNPTFWDNAFDRMKRTAGQFGFAFLLAMFGRSASENFQVFTINLLDMMFWMLAGMLLSFFTSIMFPRHVIGDMKSRHKHRRERQGNDSVTNP